MEWQSVQCEICPRRCIIAPGQSGDCRVRANIDGRLVLLTYGHPCSVHVDPVEKKPLFHFLPGTGIFSIATVGCNLHCLNCQNWEISQENPENVKAAALPPNQIPLEARRYGCKSVAYTYTDPIIFYEYVLDTSRAAHEAGLRNVLVTAGYINREPLERLCDVTDAANIDLKAMSDAFYRDVCGATLKPVLDALVTSKSRGVWIEVTNLLIPTLNDSDNDITKLARWVAANMGRETPIHFSRFHPEYKMRNLPATPTNTLERARSIAQAEGLDHVYIGNILSEDGENTRCPKCGKLLIERRRFSIVRNDLKSGACPTCGTPIPGFWE
jgi:pyruvate formate lyase activating enzyme